MRITFVARRTWPALGGIENHLRFMCDALPPLERVQILTARVDNTFPLYTDVLARETFTPFTQGQATVEPLRARGLARARLAPVVAQPRLDWLPRGRGWLARRTFEGFAAGVAPAIAADAGRPGGLPVVFGGHPPRAGGVASPPPCGPLLLAPPAPPGPGGGEPPARGGDP